MKWAILVGGLLVLVLLQTSAVPAFEILGVAPNILLVMLCCWAVIRGDSETMVLVPVAGLLIGLLSFQGTAESIGAFAPIVVLAAFKGLITSGVQMTIRTEYSWTLAIVIVATLLHFTALAVAIEVAGSRIDWLGAVTDRMLPSVIVNVLIGLIAYWLVRLPTPRAQPRVI
jgi:rod shape-determining protein MreD